MASVALPLASTVEQFFGKSPFAHVSSAGKSSYFGMAKSPGYNAANADYFLGAAGKSAVTSTHKTPLKTRALKEAPVIGEKVRFLFV